MNSDSPFTVHGDETLEARIVAWVLGEASAFEAAELERLCEERPELLVFRRRMRALHGLLTEAESAQPDGGWKLPEEKRRVLDGIFGEEKTRPADPLIEKRVRFNARRALLAIAACLILTVIIAGLSAPASVRQRKRADMVPATRGMIVDRREKETMVTLSTPLPPELIEGTPKPINVPNLEAPVNGPAGASSWGRERNQLAGGRAESSADRQSNSNAPARPSQPAVRSLSVAAKSKSDLGELASDEESLKRIDGVSEFKSSNASGGVGGGGFGLASSAPAEPAPPPAAKPASAVAVNGGALAKETPALPDMDLAKLQVSGISNYPGEVRTTIVTGFAQSSDTDHYSDSSIGNKGTAGGAPSYQYNLGLKNAGSQAVLGGEVYYSQDDRSETGELAIQVPPPTMSDRSRLTDSLPAVDKKMKESQDMPVLGNRIDATTGSLGWSGAGTLQSPPPVITAAPVASAPASAPTDGEKKDGNLNFYDLSDASKRQPAGLPAGEKSKSEPVDVPASDGAIRTNAALTNEHAAKVDEVRRSLHTAEGNFNLGKYDDAKHGYEDTLRKDPYNAAARRGLERIASAKSDYYRAAYDHTRAELLSQVDSSWELAVPAEGVDDAKGGKIEVVRESRNPAEPEPPAAPEGAVAQSKFPVTPANPTSWMLQEEGDKRALGDLPAIEEPKPALTELMEEIPAVEDPYSTFSLNISDASFQIAQAALAKGERPDPAGIKVEQFYNAVDYGDPAPSAGEPVAVNIEQSAHPVIPGRNLVRVALKTAAAGRSAAQPLRLTLLVDQSGSMVREDRRAAMDKALAGLAGLLTDKDFVTVIGFSRTPRLLAENLQGDKAGNLADLVNQSASEGGTNLEEAIKLAEQKALLRKLDGAQNRIVLFTDGAANLGNADPARLAEKVKELRQKGISFDIAGIAAEDLNDELLGGLARNGNGRYYVVGKGADSDFAKQLAGAFRPAAENVKVQVRFNPERVGRYKLIGFEKDRLKTEDFRNDAVDAAELAAEEAGVAVYQIEPLPGGSGELGEVSVRFRDAASNQMVERSWTIPHDDKAPAFDRATPSMQLAVLSMLAAEKLKGGPLADAIDFQQLAEPRANVKRFYGGSGRVGEVLRMVDALK